MNDRREEAVDYYNPVEVKVVEAIGTTFLGILAVLLLIAFLRSEARYRQLLRQTTQQE